MVDLDILLRPYLTSLRSFVHRNEMNVSGKLVLNEVGLSIKYY